MKIGSLYSGCGGLDLGAEWATGATTAWQLDLTGADVRARHFPNARQITADVLTVDPLDLGRVDVLTAGFACQDLSTAGKQASKADIHAGYRTGPTYRGVLRFVRALEPEIVVLENVPAVLAHRPTIEADMPEYGWTWVQASAIDVGAPHIRARVFAVGVRGSFGAGLVELPSERRWSPVESERAWATITASEDKGRRTSIARRADPDMLSEQVRTWATDSLPSAVRPWATPTASNFNEREDPAIWNTRRAELAERHGTNGAGEPLGQQVRTWSTPVGSEADRGSDPRGVRQGSPGLVDEVRTWPTPTARDFRVDFTEPRERDGKGESLSQAAACGSRLNPDWVETLVGLPIGWTETTGPRLEALREPVYPRGRYPADWDRSVLWPGYPWEPSRTLPDGPPCPGRPARIRLCGNIAQPQQVAAAVSFALAPRQVGLFGGAV